jgi:hypothetical protein
VSEKKGSGRKAATKATTIPFRSFTARLSLIIVIRRPRVNKIHGKIHITPGASPVFFVKKKNIYGMNYLEIYIVPIHK